MSSVTPSGGHDAFYDDAAAYVLGALTEQELERFTAHLADCAACREEVARLQVAAEALPLAALQLPAPPQLKERIMGVVGADGAERDAGEAREARLAPADGAEPRVRRLRGARRSPRRSPRRWTVGAVGALAAAAIVLAVVALAGSGSGGGGSSRVVRAQVLAHGATPRCGSAAAGPSCW